MRVRYGAMVGVLVAGLLVAGRPARATPSTCAWPAYGHDVAHSFQQSAGCAAITPANASSLVPKWVFHAADSVTASPAVVDGVVYVGDWAGNFYALDADTASPTGHLRWQFTIDPDDRQSAFGRIVSSASVHVINNKKVVVFGGGSKLYALDADTGARLAAFDVDPNPAAHAGKTVEIESSPAIADLAPDGARVFVGMDVHNDPGVARTGLLSFRLQQNPQGWSFVPLWKFDPETASIDTDETDLSHAHGCGGVWGSPAVDVSSRTVVFGTSSCNADQVQAGATTEAVFALDAMSGAERWFHRPAVDQSFGDLDADFGASPNVYDTTKGARVGIGRKSAEYFIFDRASGAVLAHPQVGQPGVQPGNPDFAVGGFIGSTAAERGADGKAVRIVGATAIPIPIDTTESGGYALPSDPAKTTWAVRALDPESGAVQWMYQLDGPSYGATSIANGVALVPATFASNLLVLESATGRLLTMLPMPAPPSSTPVAVGDSVYVGGGTRTTDAEYKSFGDQLQNATTVIGNHPLSPDNGVFAFRLAHP